MPTILSNSLREPLLRLHTTPAPPLPEVALKMDEIWPDWHHRVDPHTLDMESSQNCVLGQITGYGHGKQALAKHGVLSTGEMFLSNGCREAWIDEITARLAKDAPPKPVRRVLTAVSALVVSLFP